MLKVNKCHLFCPSIKMQNLSQKELRYIGKNRNITGYKSMPKDKLLRIIDNNNNNNNNDDDDDRGDRKSLFK